MTTSFWQNAHGQRRASYDVVIIGGGFVGCATAYWLAQGRPTLDVAIIEARSLASGASGRNAGFVLPGTDVDFRTAVERYGSETARRLWHFTRKNRELIDAELRGSAFGWRSDGSLTVAAASDENERLRDSVPALRGIGASVVHLGREQTSRRLRARGFYGSLLVPSGAVVDPLRLVHHVATQSGADVYTQHPVRELHRKNRGVVVESRPRRFRADRLVLAVGPSLPTLVPSLDKYVRPVRAQMLATEPADRVHASVPVYSQAGEFYVRQTRDGTVLAGGGRQRYRDVEETEVDRTTPAVQARIEEYLHHHFPWTESLSIRRRWSGTMGFSPDGRPVIGAVPDLPGSVFATGFTGHGMGYGFYIGRLVAETLRENTWPDPLDLFEASRFHDDEETARSSLVRLNTSR